jgi:glycosyltransferase involved in cell wall biosynthesis
MSLGLRERVDFPEYYKGFRLYRALGRVYGFAPFLEPDETLHGGRLLTHPAALNAATLDEMRSLIDHFDFAAFEPEVMGSCEGHDLVRHRGSPYGVPQSAGRVNLNLEDERQRAGVIGGASFDEIRERIHAARGAVPVEFAGWLPVYEFSGNCGTHPQFRHAAEPPPGYRFTRSSPPRPRGRTLWGRMIRRLEHGIERTLAGLSAAARLGVGLLRGSPPGVTRRGRLRTVGAMVSLFFRLIARGAGVLPALRFLKSRHVRSQVMLADYRGLVFYTSMPYTFCQNPWVVEIEDPTTLFYPLIQNGRTLDLRVADSPYFPIVKALLESEECRGILTHMRSTAELVPTLFGSNAIARKVFYTPLGVKIPQRWQRHDGRGDSGEINLLFINSWCQVPGNFFVRGGLDVLEAFAILRERYPQLRLTLRTSLPSLDDHYLRIIEQGWVRVINRFLPPEEMAALHADSHIFLLPAARVHIVSLLQAMSYGLAVVASDGWGVEEYLEHERNGLVVKGRYGKSSWADHEAGLLREDYETTYTPDPEVVQGIVEAVSRLVEDHELRRRLGRAARHDVETCYSLDHWNRGLKGALDRALSRHGSAGGATEVGSPGEAVVTPWAESRGAAC